jgi:alpha-D-ribose 1-methylphosphonate 5-triphosphate synthase subunit PhnG
MLVEVDQQLADLHEHLDMAQKQAEQDRKAEMAKMHTDIDTLRQIVTNLVNKSTQAITSAVGGIKIPAIPPQERTDLSPVLRAIEVLSAREVKVTSEPAEKPEEWDFDIIRGPTGGIVRVRAREV